MQDISQAQVDAYKNAFPSVANSAPSTQKLTSADGTTYVNYNAREIMPLDNRTLYYATQNVTGAATLAAGAVMAILLAF